MQKEDLKKPVEKVQEAAQTVAKTETVSPRVRRYRSLIFRTALTGMVIAFTVLTFLVKTRALMPVDLKLTRSLQRVSNPFFADLMSAASWAGFFPQSAIITALIVGALYFTGFRWEAVVGLVASVVVQAVNSVIKVSIQRVRPDASLVNVISALTSYSFPSGHVMFYTGFFGFIFFLVYSLLKRSWMRTFLLFVFGGLISLVGLSRIYLGHHWTSDVVGAYLLGSLALVVNIQAYRWGKKRFFTHQPVAPEPEAESK